MPVFKVLINRLTRTRKKPQGVDESPCCWIVWDLICLESDYQIRFQPWVFWMDVSAMSMFRLGPRSRPVLSVLVKSLKFQGKHFIGCNHELKFQLWKGLVWKFLTLCFATAGKFHEYLSMKDLTFRDSKSDNAESSLPEMWIPEFNVQSGL